MHLKGETEVELCTEEFRQKSIKVKEYPNYSDLLKHNFLTLVQLIYGTFQLSHQFKDGNYLKQPLYSLNISLNFSKNVK